MQISEDADVTHHHLSCELLQKWRHRWKVSTLSLKQEGEYFPTGWKVKAGNFHLSTWFTHK